MRYSKELKQSVLQRMMPPGNEPIAALAEEFNVTVATLYAWRREAQCAGVAAPGNERPADAWSAESKLAVLFETASLSEAELGEYCRAKGLYRNQVDQWKAQTLAGVGGLAKPVGTVSQHQQTKRLRKLEGELRRKDKALAEAAALLVLSKKAAAIWGDEEE
ncbi:MAG: transposase [Pigmentiphaga sp.]|nr:transposase [Pigmentiphaga sp.]